MLSIGLKFSASACYTIEFSHNISYKWNNIIIRFNHVTLRQKRDYNESGHRATIVTDRLKTLCPFELGNLENSDKANLIPIISLSTYSTNRKLNI